MVLIGETQCPGRGPGLAADTAASGSGRVNGQVCGGRVWLSLPQSRAVKEERGRDSEGCAEVETRLLAVCGHCGQRWWTRERSRGEMQGKGGGGGGGSRVWLSLP